MVVRVANKSLLPAATMLEGITALLLITVAFAIGAMIFGNVTSSSRTHNELKARLLSYGPIENSWNSTSVQGLDVATETQLTRDGLTLQTTTISYQDRVISTKKEFVSEPQ